jgi:uncharacterized oligopeptide transporter (OPT) family protein
MLIPGYAVLPMVAGGLAQWLWKRRWPTSESIYDMPIASGFIAGEALVVLVLSIAAAATSLRGGG